MRGLIVNDNLLHQLPLKHLYTADGVVIRQRVHVLGLEHVQPGHDPSIALVRVVVPEIEVEHLLLPALAVQARLPESDLAAVTVLDAQRDDLIADVVALVGAQTLVLVDV